jgi:hypothetical protein
MNEAKSQNESAEEINFVLLGANNHFRPSANLFFDSFLAF